MANRKFTEQEMLTLRNSKYVLDVSPSIVHFNNNELEEIMANRN